jgi:hypothetical protein
VPGIAPSITAAIGATVDAPFNITFTDNASWRAAITSITVGGTTLSPSAYTISSGQITFTPSASSLLQSSGTKAIVVIATGYNNATVSQAIGAGAPAKLAMLTQPTAPATNGAVLAVQPSVAIQDQYGNATTSTASVSAAVGAGTWTLGGTTSVAATSGTTTFSGLTATSAAAVTGATITFTSTALTGVTSNTFNIVAPPPANDLCNNSISLSNGISTSGTSISATYTTLTSEPYTANSDVWYVYTAINSGTVTVQCTNTASIDYDLFAYASTCPTVATGIGSTPTSSTTSETMTFTATAGTTYYIRVVNSTNTTGSTFTINVSQAIASPTLSSSSNITCSSFVANWSSVTSATSYKLDVATNNFPISVSENFENSMSIFSNSGGTYYSGNSLSSEKPLSSPFFSLGSYGFGITNGTATLTSNNLITSSSSNIQLSFKLASFSIGGNGNGADATDIVTVEISPDGGTTYYSTIRVLGNNNATWPFTGTQSASTAYDGNATPVDFQATTNATDGYSLVTITGLPAVANLKVRITLLNNAASERWVIDNFNISGSSNSNYVSGYQDLSVSATSKSVTGLSPNTKYYYRVRSTDGTNTSSNSSVDSVTTTVIPSAPTATATQILCPSATVASLSATGTAVQWYDAASAGNLIPSATALIHNTHYYATQTVNGCESSNRTDVAASLQNQWTSTSNTNWNSSSNWSCGHNPTATENILIPAGVTAVLNADFTLASGYSLTINGTGSLSIDPSHVLTIAGNADFGGRPVTLSSNNSGTAAIGQISGSLTGATNVTVERYIPNNANRAWRNLSVPTYGSQTIANAWQQGTIITGPASCTGMDVTTNGYSMYTYNASTDNLVGVSTTATAINANTAYPQTYFLYVRGDRNTGIANSNANPGATTLKSTGTLYQGTIATDISANNGAATTYHLIGNPYASPINLNSFLTANSSVVENYIYVWDPKMTNTANGVGGIVTLINNGTTYNPSTSLSFSNGVSELPSGLAFFVQKKSPNCSNCSVTFTEAMKSTGALMHNGFKTTSQVAGTMQINLGVKINDSTEGVADGLLAIYDAAADAQVVVSEDADKMNNFGESMSIKNGTALLAVEQRPLLTNDTLAIHILGLSNRNYRLVFNPSQFDPSVKAQLIDHYQNLTYPVAIQQKTVYDFTIDANAASKASDRFELRYNNSSLGIGNTSNIETVSVYPNPTRDAQVFIAMHNQATGTYQVQIVNAMGITVQQYDMNYEKGMRPAVDLSNAAKGVYYLKLSNAQKEQVVVKIINL